MTMVQRETRLPGPAQAGQRRPSHIQLNLDEAPTAPGAGRILGLQRLAGNRAVRPLLKATVHPAPGPLIIRRQPAAGDTPAWQASYIDKTFTIKDDDARVRNDDLSVRQYQKDDDIPAGKKEGDSVVIPKDTAVRVTETKLDGKTLYVRAADYGWTAAANLEGGFINETLGRSQAQFDSTDPRHKTVGDPKANLRSYKGKTYPETKPRQVIPKGTAVLVADTSTDGKYVRVTALDGKTLGWTAASNLGPGSDAGQPEAKTVTDKSARLRMETALYAVENKKIPQGSYVIVKEESQDTNPPGQYVKVASVKKDAGKYVEDQLLGWTAAANLVDNWTADIKGAHAMWEGGKFSGQADLIDIVGEEGRVFQVTAGQYDPFVRLREAAAADGHDLQIASGFRTYAKQRELYTGWQEGKPGYNKAAPAGYSDHQHGQAVDLNTGGFDTPVYNWLKEHAPALGFIRTVSGEDWHWEYRPEKAAELDAAGKFKLPGVSP